MNSSQDLSPDNLKADIVVIGGGGAGLAAAVAAAEKGASVIVLEKRRTLGGNSVRAEGFFAAESPAQERMMIYARRDELFRIAMDYAHWTIDARIVRAFIDKSGDTVRWLEEKGLRFDWVPPLYPSQAIRTWHCLKRGGVTIIKTLARNCQELGVQVFCQAAAKRLLTDGRGGVTGVLAATGEKELEIAAKCVIIATGGYGGNKELLKKYYSSYSENMPCVGLPLNGDGLLMAVEAGAATDGLGILQLSGPQPRASARITAVASEPDTVWVNKHGERFTDEAVGYNFCESANAIARQPDKISYTLFDERIKQGVIEEGLIKGVGVIIMAQRTRLTGLDKELRLEAEKGRACISDSWDGIAGLIGVSPGVLRATMDEYNSCCDRGYDGIFAKDRRYLVPLRTPPYYAIKCYTGFLGTIGGIKINHRMEVLDNQDSPLPGLYAVGSDTGGWESETYCAVLSGSTFGFAINSGRIAGENAVKYAKGK